MAKDMTSGRQDCAERICPETNGSSSNPSGGETQMGSVVSVRGGSGIGSRAIETKRTMTTKVVAASSEVSSSERNFFESDATDTKVGEPFLDIGSESRSSSRTTLDSGHVLEGYKMITIGETLETVDGTMCQETRKLRKSREPLAEDVRNMLTELGFRQSSTGNSEPTKCQASDGRKSERSNAS